MDLYFAPLACSMATRIALYEVGGEANFIQADTRTKRLVADGADFLLVNPLGQVPVLRTDTGELITENSAILQLVARAFPEAGLLGAERDLPKLQQWLGFVATELHKTVFTPLLSAKAPPDAKAVAEAAAPARFDLLQRHLDGRDFLLDRFTVADAYLATVLNWTRASGIDLATWPSVKGYHGRMLVRPSVARAMTEERALYAEEQARHAA